jgi:hypothetical protein
MPVTISGSGTITGIATGGLPDGSIAAGDLASTLDLTGKTVTLPSGTGGKILQVVSATKTDTQSFTGNQQADISGLSVSITPSSTNSKILVFGYVVGGWQNASAKIGIHLFRGSTEILQGDAAGNRIGMVGFIYIAIQCDAPIAMPFNYLDSPSTTSTTTYKIQAENMDPQGTVYINRSFSDTDSSIFGRTASTITVMEVAG